MRLNRAAVLIAILAASLRAQSGAGEIDPLTVSSPDGQIEFRLFNYPQEESSEYPRLAYQVRYRGKLLMDTSYMGLNIRDQPVLGVNLGLVTSKKDSVDRTYTVPVGKAKTIRDHYNSLLAAYMQNGTLGRRVEMEVRVYDDGVAFRYDIPWADQLQNLNLENDSTQFRFAQDAEAYPLILDNFQSGYADQYSKLTLSGIHSSSLIGLPFLVEQPGVGWVAVTEAQLDHFAGMYLHHLEGSAMEAVLAPRLDDPSLAVTGHAPTQTPWRVMLIASEPGKLLESNLIDNLNPPSEIADTSWIKAGRAVETEWNGAPMNTASAKRFLDFAADSKFEYLLLDGAWAAANGKGLPPDITKASGAVDIAEVLRYARSKKVGVWLTVSWNSVDRQMDAAFALYEKWGVAGVRIDGMNRDDQWMVDFYHRVAKAAADHKLMIDLHGAYKPEGLSRTWPNVITSDAAMGEEYAKSGARITPEHEVMLAFTRMLAGPMDYGTGAFNNVTRVDFYPREQRPMTMGTRAHQLALYVVFESPLTMVADDPEAYKGQKEFDFIREMPATWDETRAVNGKVGEYITVARRSGREWFLGSITNSDARTVDVALDFLGTGNWTAEIYADGGDAEVNPQHTRIEKRPVGAGENMKFSMAPGGGVAIHFLPLP